MLRKRRQKEPLAVNQQRREMPMTVYSKRRSADYVKVIMVYCPLCVSGCRLTCRFKMAGRVFY
ncbi:hypothetical protein BLAT2472_100054 [Burkholderia latens]